MQPKLYLDDFQRLTRASSYLNQCVLFDHLNYTRTEGFIVRAEVMQTFRKTPDISPNDDVSPTEASWYANSEFIQTFVEIAHQNFHGVHFELDANLSCLYLTPVYILDKMDEAKELGSRWIVPNENRCYRDSYIHSLSTDSKYVVKPVPLTTS